MCCVGILPAAKQLRLFAARGPCPCNVRRVIVNRIPLARQASANAVGRGLEAQSYSDDRLLIHVDQSPRSVGCVAPWNKPLHRALSSEVELCDLKDVLRHAVARVRINTHNATRNEEHKCRQ